MKPAKFDFERPQDLGEALNALSGCQDDIRVMAGGQSLGPLLNLRVIAPSLIIDLSAIAELAQVTVDDDLVLGAGVTHSRVEDGVGGAETAGLLPRVASVIAYRPIRNRGTIGGSLAHADPAGDWAPVMMVLGASLELRSLSGTRVLAASELITSPLTTVLAPDEIIATIRIPRLSAKARWGHVKFSRKPGDFADSLAVLVIDPERNGSRVVLGSRAAIPIPMMATQQCLGDQAAWPALAAAVEEDLALSSDQHGFDDYERSLHRTIVMRAISQALT